MINTAHLYSLLEKSVGASGVLVIVVAVHMY